MPLHFSPPTSEKDASSTTKFGLVRHAPTLWNREKRLQGQNDSFLLPESEAQALEWGKRLARFPWDRILSSDLGRTRRTADLINETLKVPVTWDRRLREKDWGAWTGKTVKEIREESPDLLEALETSGWSFRPPRGEDRGEVWERSRDALMDAAAKWPGARVLVVTHEGVIKCLVYRLMDRRFIPTEPAVLKPHHLHFLKSREGGLAIDAINGMTLG